MIGAANANIASGNGRHCYARFSAGLFFFQGKKSALPTIFTRTNSRLSSLIYSDGGGLYIRVRTGGSKQWVFIYKRNGKRTEIGLGGYGQGTAPVSFLLAREKADAIRDRLARGEDLQKRVTFADLMEDVIEKKMAESKNDKHKARWRMTLTEYAN